MGELDTGRTVPVAGTGIWSAALRYGDPAQAAELAAECEELGYTALWVPDGGGEPFADLDRLVAATRTVTVATGVLNVWAQPVESANAWWAARPQADRDRVLLGLGIGHGPRVGPRWTRPLATMRDYLDEFEVPPARRCLAALGPRMLELAGARTCGTHTYLVTPEHTAAARQTLGPSAFVAPEQGVVLESDPATAREIARAELARYATLPNYTTNWLRLGFTESDVESLSDRLVDALVVWGDVETITRRLDEHRAAGADHVCVQVIRGGDVEPREAWRLLADALVRA